MRRSRTATSANMPIAEARPAFSTFSTRSAVIAPCNLDTARRWLRICSLWSSCAKWWGPGAYHDDPDYLSPSRYRGCGDCLHPRHHRLQFGRPRACRANDFVCVASLVFRDAAALHDSGGPDVARSGGDGRADHADAYPASDGRGRLQRIRHDAGDYAGRRAGDADSGCPGSAGARGPADAGGQQPGLLAAARYLPESRGLLSPGGEELHACTGPLPASRHRRSAIWSRRNRIAIRRVPIWTPPRKG